MENKKEEIIDNIPKLITKEEILKKEITSLSTQFIGLVIETQEQYENAVKSVKEIKLTEKKAIEYFEQDVKSANTLHKSLKSKENQFTKPLQNAEKEIKKALLEYKNNNKEVINVDGISYKKKSKYKVIIEDESLVPKSFLKIDTSALEVIAKVTNGTFEVPGVKFEKEEDITIAITT